MTSVGSVPPRNPSTQNGVVSAHDIGPTAPRSTLGLLARGRGRGNGSRTVLVFMAPAAAGVLGDVHVTLRVVVAFSIFCVVASGTYLLNDVIDAGADKYHPVKRLRPVASGALRPGLRSPLGPRSSPRPSQERSSLDRGVSPSSWPPMQGSASPTASG